MPYLSIITLYPSTHRLLYLPNPLKRRLIHIHVSTLIDPPWRRYTFVRIDPHHCRVFVIVDQLLHHIADSWDSCPRTYLEYHYSLVFAFPQKIIVIFLLLVWPLGHPLPVVEHENIGSHYLPAFIAGRYVFTTHFVVVDFRGELVVREVLATTLEVVDTTVDL